MIIKQSFQESGTDDEDNENVKIEENFHESVEVGEPSSPALPSSPSILHGEEMVDFPFFVDDFLLLKVDLSPRSISMLEAGESADKQGIEKLLLVSGVNNSRQRFLFPGCIMQIVPICSHFVQCVLNFVHQE